MSEIKNISVVIPAHNEENYIKKCIESVKAAANEGKQQNVMRES
ncbi:MAG: glycosyltransferase [Oscillospiraceae bacterium]|nr:glycosyltransferase [Oscillospiraceae bacterium]